MLRSNNGIVLVRGVFSKDKNGRIPRRSSGILSNACTYQQHSRRPPSVHPGMGNVLGSCVTGIGAERKRRNMVASWDAHCAAEFDEKSVDKTMKTMLGDGEGAYVLNIPSCRGGFEHDAIRTFYSTEFIPANPDDTTTVLVSRTIDTMSMQIVDELVFSCTHDVEIPWMLPGIQPTNAHVKIPLVVVIGFSQDGTHVHHERIYWDQAGVFEQIGILESTSSHPVVGRRQADTLLDPSRLCGG